jgi:hypothetical protein
MPRASGQRIELQRVEPAAAVARQRERLQQAAADVGVQGGRLDAQARGRGRRRYQPGCAAMLISAQD